MSISTIARFYLCGGSEANQGKQAPSAGQTFSLSLFSLGYQYIAALFHVGSGPSIMLLAVLNTVVFLLFQLTEPQAALTRVFGILRLPVFQDVPTINLQWFIVSSLMKFGVVAE